MPKTGKLLPKMIADMSYRPVEKRVENGRRTVGRGEIAAEIVMPDSVKN